MLYPPNSTACPQEGSWHQPRQHWQCHSTCPCVLLESLFRTEFFFFFCWGNTLNLLNVVFYVHIYAQSSSAHLLFPTPSRRGKGDLRQCDGKRAWMQTTLCGFFNLFSPPLQADCCAVIGGGAFYLRDDMKMANLLGGNYLASARAPVLS